MLGGAGLAEGGAAGVGQHDFPFVARVAGSPGDEGRALGHVGGRQGGDGVAVLRALRLGGEADDGAPVAVGALAAVGADVDVVVGLVGEVGQRGGRHGGGDRGAAATGEAAGAVLKFEADVAFTGGPADGGGVAGHGGGHGRRRVAGDAGTASGGGDGGVGLAIPVGAADGAHVEVVGHVVH